MTIRQRVPADAKAVGLQQERLLMACRYVLYFSEVLSRRQRPIPKKLRLVRVVMNQIPVFSRKKPGCKPCLQVFSVKKWPANILFSSSWTQ